MPNESLHCWLHFSLAAQKLEAICQRFSEQFPECHHKWATNGMCCMTGEGSEWGGMRVSLCM